MSIYDFYKQVSTILTAKNADALFDYIIHSMDDNVGFLRSRYCYSDSTLPDIENNEQLQIVLVALMTPFDFDRTTNYYNGKNTILKMQLFYYDLSNEERFTSALKRSAAVGFQYPIRVDVVNSSYEVLPEYVLGKPYIGYPRYKCGDFVRFLFDRGHGKVEEYEGIIEIVDAFGTYEQKEEPSYDIMTNSEGQKNLCKHVIESMIHYKKTVPNARKRSLVRYFDRIEADKEE